MADLTVTAANVRPLDGAITRGFDLGGAASVGDVVYIDSNAAVQVADGNVSATVAAARGLLVAIGGGKSTGAAGDRGTVVLFGPVAGFSGLTPNAPGYLSNTVAKLADAAGAFTRIMGFAESATVFFVAPVLSTAASA